MAFPVPLTPPANPGAHPLAELPARMRYLDSLRNASTRLGESNAKMNCALAVYRQCVTDATLALVCGKPDAAMRIAKVADALQDLREAQHGFDLNLTGYRGTQLQGIDPQSAGYVAHDLVEVKS